MGIAAALTALVLAGSPALLDGATFEVFTVQQPDGKKEGPDLLVFTAGTFDSTECRRYGFTKAPYTAEAKGGAVRFEAKATSPTDGTNVWKGTVDGDRISGTLTWTGADGKTSTYRFEGKRKVS